MTTSQHRWTTDVRHHHHHHHYHHPTIKRRISTVHVCIAAIALAFVGGVCVGINGWWPEITPEVIHQESIANDPTSNDHLSSLRHVLSDTSAPVNQEQRTTLVLPNFRPWNASTEKPNSDFLERRSDLIRKLLEHRRRTISTTRMVDFTLPTAASRIPHKQQEVIGDRETLGHNIVGDVINSDGAITQRPVQLQHVFSVTAGLPQITRPYPLGLPSSRPELRSHDGVPTTILNPLYSNILMVEEKQNPSAVKNANTSAAESETTATTMETKTIQDGNQNVSHVTNVIDDLVVDGVYWSDSVESILPVGFREKDMTSWTAFSDNATIVKVLDGCGRMQNRLLVFDNGTKSCCRYRQNNDQIQGEIFSFYLAKLLGLTNLAPASLGLLYGRERQWTPVRGQLTLAQWNEQKPVVMTKFIDGLEPAYIPRHFRGDGAAIEESTSPSRRLHPIVEDMAGLDRDQLIELAQWSDLIVFDYLTANLDRVVNNMYNRQWNPDMMVAPAHNLAKEVNTGLLVFLDNESGLLHGYRLLDKYESYHRAMLQSLCVFRSRTIRAVRSLLAGGNDNDVGVRLRRTLYETQPYMAEWLPPLPDKSVKILRKRLEAVDRQVAVCERRFSGDGSEVSTSGSVVERYDSSVMSVTSSS